MKNFLDARKKRQAVIVNFRRRRRAINGRSAWSLVAVVGLLASLACVVPSFAQILGTAQLNIERRGHSATLLEDGKVLIVGGENLTGMVSQPEIVDPVSQTSSLVAASTTARTDHTATRLSDGRVLVVGGRDQSGSLTSSDIYNPLTATFITGPSLTTPRSGHTATVLADGRILIAGGDAGGSAELYNPATENFSLVTGSMNAARKFHSAIRASSGQVLLVGGVNAQNAVLNTAEVFNPASQSFYLPPTDMQTPRALATLKLLADGKVQIIGGDAEFSMEVFDPTNGIFIAKALLPPNAALLGATLSTQSRAALFSPLVVQDPILQGAMTPEQSALLDRADQSITELPSRNQALVAGGVNSAGQILNSAKLVSSSTASVTTDKTDYAPGQIVTITGSGFQPNETVDIYFHEFPEEYPDIFFSAVANQQGSFVTAEFAPQEIDLGRVFTLTAIGQTSGFTAQTAFKDARNLVLTFTGSGSVTITPSTGTVNAPISCGGTGTATGSQTVTSTCAPNITISDNSAVVTFNAIAGSGSTFAGWTGQTNLSSSTCSGTTNPCSAVLGGGPALTVTFNGATATSTTLASSLNPTTYGQSVTFTATVSGSGAPVGTVQFKVDGVNLGTPVTLTSVNTTSASASVATTTLAVGTHVVTAAFAPGAGFGASSGTLTGGQVIQKATPTATLAVTNSPQAYNGSPKAATVGISVSSVPGAVANVKYDGSATAPTSAGTYAVTADFVPTDTTNYNTLTGLSAGNFVIQKATPTATLAVSNSPQAYNGSPKAATVGISVSSVPGAVANVKYDGSATAPTNAGTYAVTADFVPTDTTNYNTVTGLLAGNFVIQKATPTATLAVSNSPQIYNGSPQAATVGISASSVPGTVANVKYDGSATAPTNAGTYAVTADFVPTDTTNYNTVTGLLAGNFVINKADPTCTVNGFTGPYDGTAHGATGSCKGIDGTTVLAGLDLGATFTNVPGGTANWTFSGGTNYNDASGSVAIVINKADATINVVGFTGVYDGNTHGASGTATGVGGANLNASLNLGATFTNVPGGTANWTFSGGTNYNDASGSAAIVINKADATINVVGFTGVYDGNTHGASGTATGVGGANLNASLNLGATFTNVPGGTANWTFSGGTNYNNAIGSVAIVINKADATINVVGFTGVYDGNAHGASGTATGVGGANLNASLNLGATFTNVPGGTANWTFSGGTNYNDASGSAAIVINKADATINVVGFTGVYDGNAHGASGTATGVGGANLNASLNLGATFTNVPGGTANWTFSGGTNYNDASGSVAIVINKADATINVVGFTGVYDGNTHGASGTATGVGGANLNASLNLGATFTNVPGGTANWTFSGGTNYNNAIGSVAITIYKRPASVTPNDASKLLGALEPVPLTTGTLTGFLAGDGVTATYARTLGETVAGSPYTISATLTPAGVLANYNITYNAAKFYIYFNFTGFFRPIDNLPIVNIVNAGSSVPIKFSLSGNQGMNIFAVGYPKSVEMTCGMAPGDFVDEIATPGSSGLSYDPGTDQYHYVWKTEKAWGNTCRRLAVKLSDGQTYFVDFKFKK